MGASGYRSAQGTRIRRTRYPRPTAIIISNVNILRSEIFARATLRRVPPKKPVTTEEALSLPASAFFLISCDDSSTGPQTTGVVQETNVPCSATTCACDREHHYTRQVTKTCDGMLASISVCSDEPVCDQVIDALAADVIACTEPASPFDVDVSACDAQ